jgi:hypothetical protein
MSHRTFVDAHDVTWEVWAVMLFPGERHRAELLASSQRRARVTPVQRENLARRVQLEQRVAVPVEFERGWLAFGSVSGSKRLAPFPTDWAQLDDTALNDLCNQAVWMTTEVQR